MRRIRVLFLGDDGVGKSSLISTLLSENFPRSVQKTMPPLIIPQDFCLPTMNAETYLLDTSSAPEDEAFTNDEIERADIAIIVYDVNNPDSIKRVTTYWLHRVTKLNEKIPIILVGNKIDLRMNTENNQTLESFLSPICKEFKQVEMGLECSAKSYLNIIEVVYSAQIAVLFPVSPLFDSSTKTLTEEFSKALRRVFRICDRDCDGLLSDVELKDFEQEIFQREMNNDHVHRVKQVIHSYQDSKARGRNQGDEPRAGHPNEQNGLTFEEFQCLQEIMIVKRKPQTCWGILRHFGYGDNLLIKEEFFENNYREIDDWESVELSNLAIGYLLRLFRQYSVDTPRGPLLSEQALSEIFAPSLKGKPWTVKRATEFIPADGRLVRDARHGDFFLEFPMWVGLW